LGEYPALDTPLPSLEAFPQVIEVRWTPQAADDLQAIHDFIARDSPRYARAEVERILAAVDQLEEFPDCVASSPNTSEMKSAKSSNVRTASSTRDCPT